MSRFTTTTRRSDKDLAIIIVTQDFLPRGRPRSIINIRGNQTLLEYQIDILNETFPGAEINVVLSHNPNEVINSIGKGQVRFIRNERYTETNDAHSLALGLQATTKRSCLAICGNVFFNKQSIKDINQGATLVNIDKDDSFSKSDIGVLYNKEHVLNFSYSFDDKWGKIFYAGTKGTELLRNLVYNKNNEKCFMFEIFNQYLDNDKIYIYEAKNSIVYEV